LLRIKKLRLKNFKSFKKAEVPFADGFTAIAGANASGKSNILDSLLFVFGITSLKMLRASKLSELINHDATEDYAKVEVELEDGEKQFTVSRMIDSKGVSSFRIDGQKKTLNEVASLLLELGVKPTGHNFVVQGDITRVIEMNAKQRREIIDEVAGLSEFEEKKAEAIKKLEQVEMRVKDAFLVLGEREKYLNELEQEKIAVQQFNRLKEELSSAKATILRTEAKKVENEMIDAKNKLEGLKEELVRKQEDKTGFFEQEKQLEQKLEELNDKIIESSSKAVSTIGREIEEKKAEIKIARNSFEALSNRLSDSLAKEKNLAEEKKGLLAELDEKKQQIGSLKTSVLNEKTKLEALDKEIAQKSGRFSKVDAESKSLQKTITQLAKQESEVKEAMFEVKLAKEKGLKEKEMLERHLSHFSGELSKIANELLATKEIDARVKQLSAIDLQEKIIQAEKKLDETINSVHSVRGKIEALNESNARITGLSSMCPTCRQEVDAEKVKSVFLENTKKIRELSEQAEKGLELKASFGNEKHGLLQKAEQLKELVMRRKMFEGVEVREKDLREKATQLKEKISLIKLDELSSSFAAAKQKLEAASKEHSLMVQKYEMIYKSPEMTDMQGIMDQAKTLREQKHEKENRINSLESQVLFGIENRIKTIEEESKAGQKTVGVSREQAKKFEKEIGSNGKELEKKEQEMHKATQNTKLLEEEKQRVHTKAQNIEEKRKALEEKISQKEKQLNEFNLVMSKNEIRLNDLNEELKQFEGAKTLSVTAGIDLRKRIFEIEKEIQELGAINMKALERFDELKAEVTGLRGKAQVIETERKAVLELIEKIDMKKKEVFMECFNIVSKKFSGIYFHFFGGEGKLSLTQEDNPFEGGLLIQAKYKENKLKNIDSMSGGEKALTALAFVFAIQSFDPAPFYVFDEADAALDKENSAKLGAMIKDMSKASQFIAITHNDALVKNANQIIGVALNQQKSSVIGLKLKENNGEKVAA